MKNKAKKSSKVEEPVTKSPPKRDIVEIASTIGKYLLALAAIAGGVQAVLSKWPVKPPPSPTEITAYDFCPQFIKGVPEENSFIVVLGAPGEENVDMNEDILLRFLDQTDSLGYIKFSYSTQTDAFFIYDVADEKCLGTNISNMEMPNNGELLEIELKGEKQYKLHIKMNAETGVLQFDLQE